MLILFSQHFISVHVNVGCLANDDRDMQMTIAERR